MSHRPAIFLRLVASVVFAMQVARGTTQAADISTGSPPASQRIEFSEPAQDTVVTNINKLEEEALGDRNLQPMSPGSQSLNPAQINSPTPLRGSGSIIVRRRGKDSSDGNRNFDGNISGEVVEELLQKELLKVPGFAPPSSRDPKERPASSAGSFYEWMLGSGGRRMQQFGLETTSARTSDKPDWLDAADDRNADWAVQESRSARDTYDLSPKNYLEWGLISPLAPPESGQNGRSSSSDPNFEQYRNNIDAENIRAKEAYEDHLKRFRTILDGDNALQPSVSSQDPNKIANPLAFSPLAPGPAGVLQSRNPWSIAPAGVNPDLLPPVRPAAPLPSSLAPPAPYTPPPRTTAPPRPTFKPPQRDF